MLDMGLNENQIVTQVQDDDLVDEEIDFSRDVYTEFSDWALANPTQRGQIIIYYLGHSQVNSGCINELYQYGKGQNLEGFARDITV